MTSLHSGYQILNENKNENLNLIENTIKSLNEHRKQLMMKYNIIESEFDKKKLDLIYKLSILKINKITYPNLFNVDEKINECCQQLNSLCVIDLQNILHEITEMNDLIKLLNDFDHIANKHENTKYSFDGKKLQLLNMYISKYEYKYNLTEVKDFVRYK